MTGLQQLAIQVETESGDGAALVKSPDDNPVCAITIDHQIPCIAITWKRYATSLQLRFIHEYLLSLIKAHSLHKILGNDTDLQTIHQEDQRWIAEDWMPRAMQAGLKLVANRTPDSHFGKVSIDNIRTALPDGYILKSFDDMGEAKRWLKETEAR